MLKLTRFMLPVALAMLALLPAVYAQDATEEPAPPPTATPIFAEAGTGSTQLVFWNGLTGADGVTLNAMSASFVEANPDFKVSTESMDWGVMYQKFQAALVAGDAPDVVVMHQSELPQFAEFGALQPVDFIYGTGEDQIDPADFAPASLEAVKYNDETYGIPFDNHGWGTWVNNALLEAAGLDPADRPENFDEFIALAQQLTLDANGNNATSADFDEENIVQHGTTLGWTRVTFLTLLAQNGGTLINEDGTVGVNSEAAMKALQTMHDLIYKYHVSAKPAGYNAWQSFAGGRLAIMPEGSWTRNFLVIDNPDVKFTVWPMVQLGDNPGTWMSSHVFYIPSTTTGDKLVAVQKYIKWISDNNVMWAESGQIPARLSSQTAMDPEVYPSNIVFAEGFNEFGKFDVQTPAIVEITSALDPEIDAVLAGQKSVEEGLNAAAERIQAILDRS